MNKEYPYPCEYGCGRDKVVSAPGNCCGREECKKNWYEANTFAGKYKYYVVEWIKKNAPGMLTKQVIKQAIVSLGYASGMAATIYANVLYYALKPQDLH